MKSVPPLRPPAEFISSEIPWMPQVPSAWKVDKVKYLFAERVQKGFPEAPLLAATQTKGVVRKDMYENRTVTAQKDLHLLKLVEQGDFVISLRSFQGGIEYAHCRGIISPAYTILKPKLGIHPEYYAYLLKSKPFVDALSLYVTGIREGQNIDYTKFSRSELPVPPLDEQQKIVNFIQQQDRRIRKFIRNKKRLIDLLKEQRGQIVDQALSLGTDESPKMRESGIHYLGKVPAHWTLKRFKFLVRINGGQVDPKSPHYRRMILIAPNHIEKETAVLFEQVTAEDQGADSGKYFVREGQIIYSKIRPNLRKATIAPCDCLCSADMYALTINESELDKQYFLKLLLSKRITHYFQDCSLRVAMPKVNRDALGACWLAYPPLVEQQNILVMIEKRTAAFSDAISRAAREIELLVEYRSRLIADAVTGKMDLRLLRIENEESQSEVDLIDMAGEDLEESSDGESEELLEEAANAN